MADAHSKPPALPAKQRLLDAAARVFAVRGLEGATTREIAHEAEVNEVTLFRLFTNKENLQAAVLQRVLAQQAELLAARPTPPSSAGLHANLTRIARNYSDALTQNLSLVRALLGEIHHHREHERQVLHSILDPLRAEMLATLEAARAANLLRPEIDLRIAVSLLPGMIFTDILRRSLKPGYPPPPYPVEDHLATCVDVFHTGHHRRRSQPTLNQSMSGPRHQLYGSDPALLSPLAARLLERGTLKWIIALAASLGAILEVIDTSITNVALPDIRGNLGATLSEAGWVSTAYACANVVIIPLSAWLGNRYGRKNYFVFSLVGFTVSSVLCGLSSNLGMLIAARVLQGLAGGGCSPRRSRSPSRRSCPRSAGRPKPSSAWA